MFYSALSPGTESFTRTWKSWSCLSSFKPHQRRCRGSRVTSWSSAVDVGGVEMVCLNHSDWTMLLQDWKTTMIQSTKWLDIFLIPILWGKAFGKVYFSIVWFVQTDLMLLVPVLEVLASIPSREGTKKKKTEWNYSLTLPFCVSARHITHSFVHKRHSGLTKISCCQCEELSVLLLSLLLSGAFLRGGGNALSAYVLERTCWTVKCYTCIYKYLLFVWALKGRRREKMKKCGERYLDDDVVYEVSEAKESRVSTAPPKTRRWTELFITARGCLTLIHAAALIY